MREPHVDKMLVRASPEEFYESFMMTHYSPRACCMFVLLTVSYSSLLAISPIPDVPKTGYIPSILGRLFLFVSAICLAIVCRAKWVSKSSAGTKVQLLTSDQIRKLQSWCPVFMMVGLCLEVFMQIRSGQCSQSTFFLLTAGLKAFPPIVFLILRDTIFSYLLTSWVLGLLTIALITIQTNSLEGVVDLFAYAVSTAVLFNDHQLQSRSIFGLVSKLHETQLENEVLAVEAQALELRAMIGNVAHDLKTVSLLFINLQIV